MNNPFSGKTKPKYLPWLLVTAIAAGLCGGAIARADEPDSTYILSGACLGSPVMGDNGLETTDPFSVTDANAKLETSIRPCTFAEQESGIDMAKAQARDRSDLESGEVVFWNLGLDSGNSINLVPQRCSVLNNNGQARSLLLLRTIIDTWHKDQVNGNELLSIITLDAAGAPERLLRQYITNISDGEPSRYIDIDKICDNDGDGYAEIILSDHRYDTSGLWLLKFQKDFSSVETQFFHKGSKQ